MKRRRKFSKEFQGEADLVQKLGTISNITETILQNLPPEAEIGRVEYEGPRIALYTKNPRFLMENNYVIADIVNTVKKRVVVRIDLSKRKKMEEVSEIIKKKIPEEAGLTSIYFDEALGEVTINVKKPLLLKPENGFDIIDLTDSIGWKVRIRKASLIPSISIQTTHLYINSNKEDRLRFLREAGQRTFRPRLFSDEEVSIITLGGFKQVGRSCILVITKESKLMLDCGIHPGAKHGPDAYPRLDWIDLDLDELDGVIISHAHLDHTGFLPVLFKYGYDGPVYCTEPTLPLMALLLSDYVKVAQSQGKQLLFDMKDVREALRHCITLPYATVTDISPDTKLVFNNAGHILGSATIHLHIGEGAYNIVYTGDFKFGKTQLFESAVWNYPRVETLVVESTYGAKEDVMPSREEVESSFIKTVNDTLSKDGKVLIPVPAVGRAQEIMLVIDKYMKNKKLMEVPVFLEGMLSEATAIHMAYPEYLSRELKSKLLESDENPFASEYFTVIEHPSNREEALREGPAIIMATSGMLEGGPVLGYFESIVEDKRNKVLFVSYQITGTLGRRVLDGVRQVSMLDEKGKMKIVNIRCEVEKIEGFSGHSDYNQIIKFVSKMKSKLQQVIVCHGEKSKVENVAYMIWRLVKLPALQPNVQESIKLL